MVMRGAEAALCLLVVFCLVAGAKALEDGEPRPDNVLDAPSKTYGPLPKVFLDGSPAICTWYGFKDITGTYTDLATSTCLSILWSDVTATNPIDLVPYEYYILTNYTDSANNESACYIGCFNLAASAPVSAPIVAPAAPPPTVNPPPPVTSLVPSPTALPPPPPPTSLVPPPTVAPPTAPPVSAPSPVESPPPSVLFSPPPPPGTTLSPPSPTVRSPPSVATSPPPPKLTGIINANAGSSIQPPGLSTLIFGGSLLLILHVATAR